ncbi:TPA: hypothetical protein PDG73_000002 [Staphylococcus aureus]|nr:hypothetical protein [Staphylococcus aureus]HDF2081293.1 hypothetical protein [Staphylococcus aureus]
MLKLYYKFNFATEPYLIYQRQKEIEQFVSTPFYEIEGSFTAKNGMYKGKAKIKSETLKLQLML